MAPFPSATTKWHQEVYPSISPSRPELSAKGKNVVVTGGGTGIGAEVAHYFAEAGASRIAVLGRREQPLLDTKASIEKKFPGVEVFVASTDVTNKSQVDAAFDKFAGTGKIDVLVSNAAVAGPTERVEEVDAVKFVESIQQNVQGAVIVAQAFLRLASTNAVVVNVSSAASHMNFGSTFVAYSASKIANVRIWDAIASGSPELSIFHIQPGIVDTEMNRQAGGVDAFGYEDKGKLNNRLLNEKAES
jgi:NAD(P)-dependent dehydrogenase (short-subunit alcohol dehydrogenase family)